MKLSIRYTLIFAILLLGLETLFSAVYNYQQIQVHSNQQAAKILKTMLHARMSLVYSDQTPFTFRNNLNQIQTSLNHLADISISTQPAADMNSPILAYENALPSPETEAMLLQHFQTHHNVSFSTFFPKQKTWVTLKGSYTAIHQWEHAIAYLAYNIIIITILWVCLLLYCRRTLPKAFVQKLLGNTSTSTDGLVDDLQQQIKTYVAEKNLMVSALAHDIKTPLTEALLRLELLEDQTIAKPIRDNLNKINTIVTSSLDYARQPSHVRKAPVDLVSLLESIVDGYNTSDFDITFDSRLDHCEASLEIGLFKRMIVNLIENAKKYATHCSILLDQGPYRQAIITIQDDGPGVPEKSLRLLGIPYFRVDKARSSNTGGTGLGLAIVKRIAELHQAEIQFSNYQGGGFQATITLNQSGFAEHDENMLHG